MVPVFPKHFRGRAAKVLADVAYASLAVVQNEIEKAVILLSRFISEPIPRVENAEVIDVLDVAFLKVQRGTVLFC